MRVYKIEGRIDRLPALDVLRDIFSSAGHRAGRPGRSGRGRR